MEQTENTIVILSTKVLQGEDPVLFFLDAFSNVLRIGLKKTEENSFFTIFHKSVKKDDQRIFDSALQHFSSFKRVTGKESQGLLACIEDHFKENEGSLLITLVDKSREDILRFCLGIKEGGTRNQCIQIIEYSEYIRTESNGG